ncbi:hypothetical protein MNBD_PLANCTO03-1400 [hydrothermal vent metagenome]|uniref:Uncharacterized protein n=1 Tax=hydrothermal vent metagenome TaxID=652676 RepID=A0A3B1DVC1_9ZZZZ
MATHRNTRSAGLGVLMLSLLGFGAWGCSSGGSARADYYASRSIHRPAQAGDGSVVALSPKGGSASWTASLTFVPIADTGDFADGR